MARCSEGPLRRHCAAAAAGDAASFAGARPRRKPREVALACAVLRDRERVLFLRNADDAQLLARLWELPTVEVAEAEAAEAADALAALVRERCGALVELRGPVARVRHDIVGRRITACVYEGEFPVKSRRSLAAEARLLSEAEFGEVGLPALPLKVLRARARRCRRSGALRAREAEVRGPRPSRAARGAA